MAGNPKTITSLVIFAFLSSGFIEIIKILIRKDVEKLSKRGKWLYENLSLGFMAFRFLGLVIFGLLLRFG